MKVVVYGPDSRVGVLNGDKVLDLEHAANAYARGPRRSAGGGQSLFLSLMHMIDGGERALDLARTLDDEFAGSGEPGVELDLASVRLRAPFPGQRLALAGANYADHIANAMTNFGTPTSAEEMHKRAREKMMGGFWVVSPPEGPDATIETPTRAEGRFDYEGEVAVVLGKSGKRLKASDWTDHIWGTTLLVDWSIRGKSMAEGRQPFYTQKIFDGSKSLGPAIAVGETDPGAIDVETFVNGELRQSFNTSSMIYSFEEVLEHMSQDLTMLAGDVLSGGTGPGTAFDSTVPTADGDMPLDKFLKPGDTVEVRAPAIGSLTASIVAGS